MKKTRFSKALRKLVRFVRRNKKALAIRALVIAVPVLVVGVSKEPG
ncbi:MAG: hypothetical protein LKH04_04360 [Lachnospiraceae bacterium]|jgi:hypothetical protein|nr:hypothetical protein [Lachnospiraceae bacterium]MCI1423520.1 hypothetical protein [Lachnospiraceae bacterium]